MNQSHSLFPACDPQQWNRSCDCTSECHRGSLCVSPLIIEPYWTAVLAVSGRRDRVYNECVDLFICTFTASEQFAFRVQSWWISPNLPGLNPVKKRVVRHFSYCHQKARANDASVHLSARSFGPVRQQLFSAAE